MSSVSSVALDGGNPNSVYFWLVSLLIIEIFVKTFAAINRVASSRFHQKIELVSNELFFKKTYELSQEQFDNQEFNTKLERARDGLYRIWRTTDELYWAASSLIGFLGSITTIVFVSPLVGLGVVLSIIPSVIVQIKQNKIREDMYKNIEPTERVAYHSRWMLMNNSFMPEIRLMNAFNKLIDSWRYNLTKSHTHVFDVDKKMAKIDAIINVIQPLFSLTANIIYFRMLLSGVVGLDRFIFLRGVLEQASSSVYRITDSIQNMHAIFINLSNFNVIFKATPTIPNGNINVTRPLTIEFRSVSFAYPNSTKEVLRDVSFIINPGSKLAIVGENGAGKSTLIKLLLRQYLPTKGEIIINGVNIKDIEQERYYSAISNLSQEFLLAYHLTIRDNLSISLNKEITDKKIFVATDIADASNFIKKLPRGLDTRLDPSFDDGSNLSGGQKQRLGIARALLKNSDLMILDEPTSSIDAKAEYSIFNNIYKAHSSKTTLIVSHRFSTVRKADVIIVMNSGKIIEYGSHEELVRHDGLYKEMFDLQAEGYR